MKETAKKHHLDDELLTKNLIDGVNVEYAEYSGKVHWSVVRATVAKYPNVFESEGTAVRAHLVFLTSADRPRPAGGHTGICHRAPGTPRAPTSSPRQERQTYWLGRRLP